MFIKLFSIISLMAFLAACASGPTTRIVTSKEYVPLEVNEGMYTCPYLEKSEWPAASKLTEVGLVALLSDVDFNNRICFESIRNLKHYIEEYNKKINERNR